MSSATHNVGLILYIKTIPIVTLKLLQQKLPHTRFIGWLCSYICKFMSIAKIFKYILAHAHKYILIFALIKFPRVQEGRISLQHQQQQQLQKTNSVTQIYSWTGANKPELIHFYFSAFFNFQGVVSSFQRTLLPMAQCGNLRIILTLRFYVKSIQVDLESQKLAF